MKFDKDSVFLFGTTGIITSVVLGVLCPFAGAATGGALTWYGVSATTGTFATSVLMAAGVVTGFAVGALATPFVIFAGVALCVHADWKSSLSNSILEKIADLKKTGRGGKVKALETPANTFTDAHLNPMFNTASTAITFAPEQDGAKPSAPKAPSV